MYTKCIYMVETKNDDCDPKLDPCGLLTVMCLSGSYYRYTQSAS